MSFDSGRAEFMRDVDRQKRKKVEPPRAQPVKPAAAKTPPPRPAQAAPAAPSAAAQAELKRLRGKNDDLEAKLGRVRDIAVEMSKRSARMSNVPGYVLKNYADDLIKKLNGK